MIVNILKFLLNDKRIYFVVLAFVIIDRIFLLTQFGFKFVGSDDMIFWQGAHDYMHGEFHTPYFYGQDYNFMLESVIAVPFLLLNIPYYQALPLSTTILSIFPFFIFSYTLYRRGYLSESLFFISLPLFLPIEYGILTTMTRGFISGLFFCGFLVFPLLNPTKKSSWIISATMISAAYIFNPNSLVFSFPVAVYMLLCNFKQLSFYLISVLSALPILLIEHFAKDYCDAHPNLMVHHALMLEYKTDLLFGSFKELDVYFSFFSPLIWFAGWLVLVAILLIGISLMKRDPKKAFSLILGVLFILFTLGINKIHDHIGTIIFLSSKRMYICIPLLTGLAFFWQRKWIVVNNDHFKIAMMSTVICTVCIKLSILDSVIDRHTKEKNYGAISIRKVDDVRCECARIKDTLAVHPASLVMFVASWKYQLNSSVMEFYNYGCPLLEKDFPKTMMNIYERRDWVFLKESKAVAKNILFYNSDIDFNIIWNMKNCKILSDQDPKMFLIYNNTLPTDSLFRFLKLDLWTKAP